ncbi:LamG-like jellyroll fold domain-containing protein [Nanoarchaeota archaeon]
MNRNGTVKSYTKINDTSLDGLLDTDDIFGGSIAGIGDLDGDGVQDIAVGAYGDDDGKNLAGAAWIVFMEDGFSSVINKQDSYQIRANSTQVKGLINYNTLMANISSGWQHVVLTSDETNSSIYINGVLESTSGNGNVSTNDYNLSIGNYYNGTIDELQIYNRKLSPEQIKAIYQNRTDLIVSQETLVGETWKVNVTPNDGTEDGNSSQSNSLTIQNILPTHSTPILNATDHPINTTNANLTAYNQSTADTDGDSVRNIYNWFVDGTSFTIFNMPFEGHSGDESSDALDYSGYEKDGTVNGPTWNSSGGLGDGGAYEFEEGEQYIEVTGNINNAKTISFWWKPRTTITSSPTEKYNFLLDVAGWNGAPSGAFSFIIESRTGQANLGKISMSIWSGAVWYTILSDSSTWNAGTWYHVVGTLGSSDGMKMYVNGVLQADTDTYTGGLTTATWYVGHGPEAPQFSASTAINATIDEVTIYDRTLSIEQINALYENRTDLIVSQETSVGETWKVNITPNDGTEDGNSLMSNEITIQASPNNPPTHSTPILNATDNPNNTSSANLTAYNQSTSDLDGDSVKNIYNWFVDGNSIAVLNMPFEGHSGDESSLALDYSGYRNNGSVISATWDSSGGIDGKGAYDFDGNNDYIDAGNDSSLAIENELTISAWVYPTKFHVLHAGIAAKGYPCGATGGSYGLKFRGGGAGECDNVASDYDIRFHTENSTVRNLVCWGNLNSYLNGWHHFVGTYNGSVQKLYWDGVERESLSVSGNISVYPPTVKIGYPGCASDSEYFQGSIDEVMILNRSLSAEQIKALYENRTDLIVSQETSVGETWKVNITPNDGNGDGNSLESNELRIRANLSNNLSTHTTPILNATDNPYNRSSANLTVYNQSTADTDGDSVRNIYNWFVDGTSFTIFNMPFEGHSGDESSDAMDYSGYGNNGTVSGATWNSTSGVDGKGAYEFDGKDDNDSIIIPNALNLNPREHMTISAWFYPRSGQTGSHFPHIISKSTVDAVSGYGWSLYFDAGNLITLEELNGSAPEYKYISFGYYKMNQWNHVAIVADGNNRYGYINGVQNGSEDFGRIVPLSSSDVYISRNLNYLYSESEFNGSIDEILIFNRSLSPEQIKAIYENKSNLIVSQETNAGEVWSVNITPNDGTEDGPTLQSNSITIQEDVIQTSSCGELNESGETYKLIQNVSSNTTCFNITANNITLDGNGYNMNYSANGSFGKGIVARYLSNLTITNLTINEGPNTLEGTPAIDLEGINNSNITNNRIFTNVRASGVILRANSMNNLIESNLINTTSTASAGISLSGVSTSYNVIRNNTIVTIGVGAMGINLEGIRDNEILNNTIRTYQYTTYGINIEDSENITLLNNELNTSRSVGIVIEGTTDQHYNHTIGSSNLAHGLPINYSYRLSNIILNGEDFSNFGQVIIIDSNNVTINNSEFFNDGMSLFHTTNSTIQNCNFTTDNGYGVFLYSDSNNNTLLSNILNTSGTHNYALYSYLSHNNSIINNEIISSGSWGRNYIRSSDYNTFYNNSISTYGGNSPGMDIAGSSFNTIENNVIYTQSSSSNAVGINTNSDNNNIINNTITALASYTLAFDSADSNYIDRNRFNYRGAFLQSSNNNIIKNSSIISSNHGIFFETSSTNNSFYDLIIDTNNTINTYAIYLDDGYHNFSINDSTLNSSDVEFSINNQVTGGEWNFTNVTKNSPFNTSWGAGANGTINIHWYLDVNVKYANGSNVSGANVSINDNNNFSKFSGFTDSNGNIPQQTLLEYSRSNETLYSHFTNFTVNASINPSAQTSVNLSENNQIFLVLGSQDLSECEELNQTGVTYILQNDVSSNGTCFNITANNIALDGQGYSVNYSKNGTLGYGVNTYNVSNIRIKNLSITEGSTSGEYKNAININNSIDVVVSNNTINLIGNRADGVSTLTSSSNITIENNTIISTGIASSGIDIGAINVTAKNNNITVNQNYGILVSSVNNTITGNIINITGSGRGIYLTALNNYLTNNTITTTSSSAYGISLYLASNTILYNNHVNTTSTNSYYIEGTAYSHFDNTIDTSNKAEGLPVNYSFNISNQIYDGIDYTQYGQVIFGYSNNITIKNSNFTKDSLNFFKVDNSSIINNIINSSTGYGIWFSSRSDNHIIENNSITTTGPYGWGILSSNQCDNLTITDNTLSTSGTSANGIYFIATYYNNISNNNITTQSGIGVYGGLNQSLTNNSITSLGSHGIQTSHYSNVINNTVNASQIGIYLYSSQNSLYENNTVYSNNDGIKLLLNALNTRFINNYLEGSSSIVIEGTHSNITFERITFNATSYAIGMVAQYVNLTMKDSIINGSTDFRISGLRDGEWNLTNVSKPNGDPLTVSWQNNANGTLNTHWYMDVHVLDRNGADVDNANVSIYDKNNNLKFFGTTNSSGRITQQTLLEYSRENDSIYSYYTNFTVNASKNPSGSATANLTNNMLVNVSFSNNPPTQSTPTLSATDNPQNLTSANLTAYNQSTNDLDNDTVKNIYNWFVNNNSIAILNMPFEANGGSESTTTKDYSGYGNNGTISGVDPWRPTGGYDGKGAYQFDGITNNITFNDIPQLKTPNWSVTLWINHSRGQTAEGTLFSLPAVFTIYSYSNQDVRYYYYNSTGQLKEANPNFGAVPYDTLSHFAITTLVEGNQVSITFYKNGEIDSNYSDNGGYQVLSTPGFQMGSDGTFYFNGTMDEVMFFNRTLSKEQVKSIFNNRSDLIVSQETTAGETWKVNITPNDGIEDGITLESNDLLIRSPTTPTATVDDQEAAPRVEGSIASSIFGKRSQGEWDYIQEGENVTLYVRNDDIPITIIKIWFSKVVYNFKIYIQDLLVRPTFLPEISEPVYDYFYFNGFGVTQSEIDSAGFIVKVDKSWLNSNDKESVALFVYYNQKWNEFEAYYFGEDNDHIYFESFPPLFGYYAVVGKEGQDMLPGEIIEIEEEIFEEPEQFPSPKESNYLLYAQIAIIFLILKISILFIILRLRKLRKP